MLNKTPLSEYAHDFTVGCIVTMFLVGSFNAFFQIIAHLWVDAIISIAISAVLFTAFVSGRGR